MEKLHRLEARPDLHGERAVADFQPPHEGPPDPVANKLLEAFGRKVDGSEIICRESRLAWAETLGQHPINEVPAEPVRGVRRAVEHRHPSKPRLGAILEHAAEAESASLMTEEAQRRVAIAPLLADDAEAVIPAERKAVHLIPEILPQDLPVAGFAAVEMKQRVRRHVAHARVDTTRGNERSFEWHTHVALLVPDRAVPAPHVDLRRHRAVAHPQRLENHTPDPVCKGHAGARLDDVARQIEAEIRIAVSLADGKAQPGPRDAAHVSSKSGNFGA